MSDTRSRREYHRQRYLKNPEKYIAYSREYRKNNPEWVIANREKNRIKRRKYVNKWRKNNISRLGPMAWAKHLKRKYQITPEQYNFLSESQNHKCAICLKESTNLRQRLNVDHCHKTKNIRGLLCWDCNIAIGQFKDNPKLMERAALYVRAHLPHNNN